VGLNFSSYRAVLFDVDGTISETEGDGHLPAFNQVFQEFGLPWYWRPADYAQLLGITGGAERMLAYAQTLGESFVQSADGRDRIRQMHQRKNEIYAERLKSGLIRPRQGFVDLVRKIVASKLDWAVVTTTSRANWDALWAYAIAPHGELPMPKITICGEDVAHKKPDPEAYRLALARLGLDPSDAIAIEDSPNGLRSAIDAGIDCAVVRSQFFSNADFSAARLVVSELSDLL
jgi:beta-phosphoglucomutase-like phosphatase (HAD superfamily)